MVAKGEPARHRQDLRAIKRLSLLREVVQVMDLRLRARLLKGKGGFAFAVQAVAGEDNRKRTADRLISPLSSLR